MMNLIRRATQERGAAAIEFAIILPVLIVLLLGLFEFGRIYNVQISLTNAAREGARSMAIAGDPAKAKSDAAAAAPSVNPAISTGQITVTPATCTPGTVAQVTIDYTVTLMTGYFGPSIPLTAKGAMRCGG